MAGITAEQIVSYLRLRALPALRRERGPVVPQAVAGGLVVVRSSLASLVVVGRRRRRLPFAAPSAEQIALWAKERARVRCESGALYVLPTLAVHRAAVDAARRAGVLLFAAESSLQLIVAAVDGPRLMTQFFAGHH